MIALQGLTIDPAELEPYAEAGIGEKLLSLFEETHDVTKPTSSKHYYLD